jgi:hypothetical protein
LVKFNNATEPWIRRSRRNEKFVANNPLYAPATRQLALLYGQLSTDSSKAFELVTKALQAYPDDPDIANISAAETLKTLIILASFCQNCTTNSCAMKYCTARRKRPPCGGPAIAIMRSRTMWLPE